MRTSRPVRRSRLARAWRSLLSMLKLTPPLSRQSATEMDHRIMQRAIDLARAGAAMEEVPVGAVVYRTADGEVLGEAHNLRESDRDPTAHAEVLALREASQALHDWRLSECTLVVTLEPCTMCAGAIINARVGRLVYGASDPKAGACESLYEICDDRRLNHLPEVIRGVMAPECRGLLRDFFKERRRQNKLAKQAG